MSECEFDADCPGPLWCYMHFGNSTPRFCDCPSFYGKVGKDSGCDGFTVHTFLWLVPTIINALFVGTVVVYSVWKSQPFRAIFYWSRENREGFNVPPAIKIWISGFLCLVCMLISFAVRLWELFAPNTFITLERAVRASNATPEILKSSRLQTVYFIFFMAYILFAVIAVIESGLLWVELAYKAKKLSARGSFRKSRAAALFLEVMIVVITVVSVILGTVNSLALFLYLGAPLILVVFGLILYGRCKILSMLTGSLGGGQEEGRRASKVSQSGKREKFVKELKRVSRTVLIALILALIPFVLIFIGVQSDYRTVRPGEIGYFVFAFQSLDTIVAYSAMIVFIHMNGAIKALGGRSRRSSKESVPAPKIELGGQIEGQL